MKATVAALVAFVAAAGLAAISDPPTATGPLVVHEWGTFTSIADAAGNPAEWQPLIAPSELPCFVERSGFFKGALSGTIRMETPVLYFYAPRDTTVDVGVRFRAGVVTEWFPHARVGQTGGPTQPGSESTIAWSGVRIAPGATEMLPLDTSSSHYYTARRTNAALVAVGTEHEKFLFYRGVGRFTPPVAATVDGSGEIAIRSLTRDRIDDIILFTNENGRLRFEVRHQQGDAVRFDPEVTDRPPDIELQTMLLAHGLYAPEAAAMIETWRDSWFEPGTRIFYVTPSEFVDSVLPLAITPRPNEIARVFVARTELITPRALDAVKHALLADDAATLATYGRFVDSIGRRLIASAAGDERSALEMHLQRAASTAPIRIDSCGS